MEFKSSILFRLWVALCPLLAVAAVIFFANEINLMLSPFSNVSFTMIVFIILVTSVITWSFFYNTLIDLFFLIKWIGTGSKKEEYKQAEIISQYKKEIEMALERIRLQLNDLNKISPEELLHYAKMDFVNQEVNKIKSSFEDRINSLKLSTDKDNITSLPRPELKSSTNL